MSRLRRVARMVRREVVVVVLDPTDINAHMLIHEGAGS